MDIIERSISDCESRGSGAASPSAVGALAPQAVASLIADRIGRQANAATVSSACPSGLDAVILACGMIESGEAELALAGGADAPIVKHTFAAFTAAGLCSWRTDRSGKPAREGDRFSYSSSAGPL